MTDCDPEKYYTFEEIYPQTGGTITAGYENWRLLLTSILLKLPAYVVDAVLRHCLFLMPDPEVKGSFIPNRIIKYRHIIHFPNSCWVGRKTTDRRGALPNRSLCLEALVAS